MTDREIAVIALDADAQAFMGEMVERWGDCPLPPGVLQWLLTLLERHGELARAIVPRLAQAYNLPQLRALIERGETGERIAPDKLTLLAGECARTCGRATVCLRDLACVILTLAGCALGGADAESVSGADCETVFVNLDEMPREDQSTPLLNQLGIDLTHAAREETLTPVVGREEEIELVIETLCRRTKRNPALVGPAGVGKTAIVEGLAQCVVSENVPLFLRGARIVMLSVTSLVAGCSLVGQFEERVKDLLKEAGQPGIILFIDEAHTMLGAGSAGKAGNDLANMLKQAMARGEIACIAATTDEEYRQFIEADPALERRFQPIRVQGLTAAQTLEVLGSLRKRLAVDRGVDVPDALLAWMVRFSEAHMRNRHFPDKAVDILEQCVAFALAQGHTALTQTDTETVGRRMVGMPQGVEERLIALRDTLRARSLLPPATIDAIVNRLGLTLRGLDFRTERPNAVILLLGPAAAHSGQLAEIIAETLFGATDRVVTLEMDRIVTPADLSLLLGAPPGYIGYGGRVPLHQTMQMPWCVLRVADLQACHPVGRDVLAQGLHRGCIALADGKRAYLSDAVVVISAACDLCTEASIGFGPHDGVQHGDLRCRAANHLGHNLIEEVDILCAELCANPETTAQWLRDSLLADLDARFRPQGVCLSYDASLLAWLAARGCDCAEPTDWERLVENELCPVIIPHLPNVPATDAVPLRLSVANDACVAEPMLN